VEGEEGGLGTHKHNNTGGDITLVASTRENLEGTVRTLDAEFAKWVLQVSIQQDGSSLD